jgi:Ferric iron reductase FhuF-like transporter/FhuF 2Fe-2S C-terminal domain
VASPVDAADALRRGSALGPFFAVELDVKPQSWQRLSDLLPPDYALLDGQLGQTRQTLATMSGLAESRIEPRVAASLWLLGWAARLFAPSLGAALHGVVPTVPADRVLWRPSPGQPRPLAMVAPKGRVCVPDDAEATASHLYAACITGLVEPLVSTLSAAYPVSLHVLWGNVASAVAGAASSLDRPGSAPSRPARDIAQALLQIGALSGRGGFTRPEGREGPAGPRGFQRTSCCLLYRVAGAGICSDCVLATRRVG